MESAPSHLTPLRLTQRLLPAADRGCPPNVLVDADWLGTRVPYERSEIRRYLTDLSLPVRDRSPSLTFKKAAYVDLGAPRKTAAGCELEISWQSSSLAPLFPVFAGRLLVTPAEIRLEGYYAPPGGEIGAVLDRAFLNIAARGTARWLLDRVAEALSDQSRATAAAGNAPARPAEMPHGSGAGHSTTPGRIAKRALG